MSPFEYLTVFVSVVLGLAVIHLLSGVALLLDTRVRASWDWIHAVWTANVLITTVFVWWFNFHLTAVQVWALPHFINLVAYCVVLYLMAGLLYPVRGQEVTEFRSHFEANRVRFFAVCLVFQVIDFADVLLEREALAAALMPLQVTLIGIFAAGFIGGMITSYRPYHGALAIAWLLTCLFWGYRGLSQPIVTT